MADISPRTSTLLYGHEEAEAVLMQSLASGKMAHGWLISGPRGIGKATLAYRFARTLLSGELPEDMHAEHPVFRRIVAGSHPGLQVIEQLYDEKKEENARDISVQQAREIAKNLSLTAGEGEWRVVIVDAVDNLNANGANAILKILEEPPPKCVLLLISHNPGKLLPTIRSRCRALRLHPLDNRQFTLIMRHVSPAIESADLRTLAVLSGHSPGIALELHAQGAVAIYGEILALVSALPRADTGQIHAFSEAIASGKIHTNWHVFTQLILCLFERITLRASGLEPEPVSEVEKTTLEHLATMHPAHIWAAKWQQVADQFLVAERLHLDYKQVIIAFFHSITDKEIFQLGSAAA